MNYINVEDLKGADFTGFKTVSEMKNGAYSNLPLSGGVYMIVRPDDSKPHFLPLGSGGHFKGQDPNVTVEELQANWVDGTCVLYIGKATSLKKRLSQYMRFGNGSNVGHWGGRYIWQLENVDRMLVCWKTTTERPRDVEKKMIAEFKKQFGRWPFANLQS